MRQKYAIHPGWVISIRDGDRHWVGERQLMGLYNLKPRECIVVRGSSDLKGYTGEFLNSLKHLYPLSNGNYYDANEKEI